jgi:uncharacterized membrane protein
VELIADRGYRGKVKDAEWAEVCRLMEQAFRRGEFERGVLDGVAATSQLISRNFPTSDANELPNQPVLL